MYSLPTLVSADVTSLYPNIPLKIGIDAIRDILSLQHTQHIINDKVEIDFIITLLHYVLFNCYVINIFDNKVHLQINGTAMGTPCAVVFANLFMLWHHYKILNSYTNPLNSPMLPLIYKRFIDDLFLVFKKLEDALYFIRCFNNVHPTIRVENPQISNCTSNNELYVDILDITVKIKSCPWLGGEIHYKLITKLFSKTCNTHMYLPPFSLHQAHIYPNWIKGEINRIRIICSDNADYNYYLDSFVIYLLRRGYSRSFIDPIFNANKDNDRDVLITNRIRKNDINIVSSNLSSPLTLYATYSNTISQIINNNTLLPSGHIRMLEYNYRDIFNISPRVIFRNRPNLSAILTSYSPINNSISNDVINLINNIQDLNIAPPINNSIANDISNLVNNIHELNIAP